MLRFIVFGAAAVGLLKWLLRRTSDEDSSAVSVADDTDAAKSRRDVFARSYDEVLAVLKHQDDKLNRTLTAIAFLTAAGVALFARVANARLHFPESGTSIPAVLFVVFLIATALAVVLALVAIGPSASYPFLGSETARQRRREAYLPEERSLIFYLSITRDPEWEHYVSRDDRDLLGQLARNFHREARVLAHRVEYKVARSRESGAFVQLAILALALLGIFSISGLSLDTRWWLATGLVLALLVMPFVDLLHMRKSHFEDRPIAWSGYVLLAVSIAVAAVLLALSPSEALHWPALYYALGAVVCARLGVVSEWSGRLFLGGSAAVGVGLITVLSFMS
jgi:hypothetical protein